MAALLRRFKCRGRNAKSGAHVGENLGQVLQTVADVLSWAWVLKGLVVWLGVVLPSHGLLGRVSPSQERSAGDNGSGQEQWSSGDGTDAGQTHCRAQSHHSQPGVHRGARIGDPPNSRTQFFEGFTRDAAGSWAVLLRVWRGH
ncbi:hypothetical protein [Streptomyces sp. NPDC059906]|uniref:hypothetical protein n=1 Tax=Streptomyces sp. NPDC059906 TaxID=3346997 RepID=UPI00365C6A72